MSPKLNKSLSRSSQHRDPAPGSPRPTPREVHQTKDISANSPVSSLAKEVSFHSRSKEAASSPQLSREKSVGYVAPTPREELNNEKEVQAVQLDTEKITTLESHAVKDKDTQKSVTELNSVTSTPVSEMVGNVSTRHKKSRKEKGSGIKGKKKKKKTGKKGKRYVHYVAFSLIYNA